MTVSENRTRNQHYVSQVEQRFNAIDNRPNRIFSFSIVDRELSSIRLDNPKGKKILKNLSGDDMFSLSVAEKERENFEEVWGRYEMHHGLHVESLLRKIAGPRQDVKKEIRHIVALKVLGLVRNPYVGQILARYKGPSWEALDSLLVRNIDKLSIRPPPESCAPYEITLSEYQEWIKFLLVLFHEGADGATVFDRWVDDLLYKGAAGVTIFMYSKEHTCLLGDRPCFYHDENGDLIVSSNVTRNMFFVMHFIPPENIPPEESEGAQGIRVSIFHNNLKMLRAYNFGVVRYSAKRVFGASTSPHGVTVAA